MRKIIAIEFITLDGVIQGPGGPQEDTTGGFTHGGWIEQYSDATLGSIIRKRMAMQVDLLLGRFTYDIWSPYWPNNDSIWPNANHATKYVASNTLTSLDWKPSVLLQGDVAAQLAQIKQQPGPDMHLYGSAGLFQTLLKHDLVDTLWLMIHPITFGTGKRLFVEGTIPATFSLTNSVVTSKGVIVADFERPR